MDGGWSKTPEKMLQIKKIVRPVSKEFRKNNCGFDHTPPDDFVKSQWQSCTKNNIYLIYRWVIALFFIGVVLNSMFDHEMDGYYFIYLTNWGILMCMFTNVLGAILVTIWHYHPEYADQVSDSNSMPTTFKIYWGMHVTTLISSLIITIIYWSILHTSDTPMTSTNILTHAFNAAFMFMDLLIVAYPVRLLHIFLPVGFGIVYTIFTIIYYACGGLDIKGNVFIYTVLDWSKPCDALITFFGVLILCCFIYILIFIVYKLRVLVYRRFLQASPSLPTRALSTSTIVTHPPIGISMVLGNYGYENRSFSGSTEKISS